jgi:molybdopterin-guanine dinucleotide biosynthesis protein A
VPVADSIHGLVLAGGQSRRMGRDKALLERDGRTQLEYSVELLRRHVERVFVSVRPDQAEDAERGRFEQITDRYSGIGPVAGILSALDAFPDTGWIVLACDLPNVDDRTIEFLLRERSASESFTAYRSHYDGLPEPLCAFYGPEARAVIAGFVADGIICPRKIMIRSDTRLLELPEPSALDNVNTPEDLVRAGIRVAS